MWALDGNLQRGRQQSSRDIQDIGAISLALGAGDGITAPFREEHHLCPLDGLALPIGEPARQDQLGHGCGHLAGGPTDAEDEIVDAGRRVRDLLRDG